MKISQSSSIPIYQQVAENFRNDILAGRIKGGEYLPSIRELARELKISVITTMKAYEQLESEGLVTAVQGKGFLVNESDSEMLKEQHMRNIEKALGEAIKFADIAGMSDSELIDTLSSLIKMKDI